MPRGCVAEPQQPQRGRDVGDVEDLHAVDGPRLGPRRGPLASGARRARPRPGSRAGPPRPAAAAGRGPGAARRPGRSRPSRRPRAGAGDAASWPRRARPRRRGRWPARTSRAPPTVEAKTSWACSRIPQCCWSTASTIATREESSPDVVRRGRSAGAGVTSACTSASIGRRPSMVTATQVPGTWLVVVLDEQAGRVGDRDDALGAEVEAADLVDRAEAVLHRADHPEAGVAVALEVQHHVDEVLEHPRAGDRAVLGDVADEDGGDVAGLGDPDQRGRDLLDLGDAARARPRRRRRRWSGPSRRPAASGRTCSMWVSTAPRSVSAAR